MTDSSKRTRSRDYRQEWRMAEGWRKERKRKDKRNLETTGINKRRELKTNMKRGDEQTRRQEWGREEDEHIGEIFYEDKRSKQIFWGKNPQYYTRKDNRARTKKDNLKRNGKKMRYQKKGQITF